MTADKERTAVSKKGRGSRNGLSQGGGPGNGKGQGGPGERPGSWQGTRAPVEATEGRQGERSEP